jgi:hypothetical protein
MAETPYRFGAFELFPRDRLLKKRRRRQSEQAFSDDGGKTWEVNRINTYTLVKHD